MMKVAPTVSTSRSQPLPLNPTLIFEDPHLIVLSKPAGLLSQGEQRGDPNLVDWLRTYLGRHYVGLIHRLDRNTSGIMIVAKRSKSAERLTRSLQTGNLKRSYLGWIVGTLPNPIRWTHQLLKNSSTNTVSVVSHGGKSSALVAQPLRYSKWHGIEITLASFHLETGRSHQIRVQAAYEGFPLLGDKKYGAPFQSVAGQPHSGSFPRVALHSYQIEFPHPMSGEILKFEDPLPHDLNFSQNPTL